MIPIAQFVLALVIAIAAMALNLSEEDSKDNAAWRILQPAMFRFREGGPRQEFFETCKKLLASHSGTRYDQELKSLTTALDREVAAKRPAFLDKKPEQRTQEENIHFWIYQLRDLAGHQMSDPGYPSLFAFGLEEPTAADQLLAIGPPAIPYLIDALEDNTPTRTLAWQRSFYPVHFILRRQDVAMKCLERIVGCQFYDEGSTSNHLYMDTPERRKSALDNVKEWWRLSKGVSQARMIRNQLAIRHKNITLRGYDQIRTLEALAMLEGPEAVIAEARQLLTKDQYGLNSPVQEVMDHIDPQAPVRAAFERFKQNKSQGGDYVYILKYGDKATYQEMALRLEKTEKLDPGSWNEGDQARSAARNGQNWAIPIIASLLKKTEMTGGRGVVGGEVVSCSTADVAMEEFQRLSGKDFGYKPEKSEAERLDLMSKARQWWEGEGRKSLAKTIAEDHPPVLNPGDLLLSEHEIDSIVAGIEANDDATRRKSVASLGEVFSFKVQRALLSALAKEKDSGERQKILKALGSHPSFWQVPVVARVLEQDQDTAMRVAAGQLIKKVVAAKTRVNWWMRLETRDQALQGARRVAQDVMAPGEVRQIAADILKAWGSFQDRPLLARLAADSAIKK